MPVFSLRSYQQLDTCDLRLQKVLLEVIKHYDFTVIEGYRSREAQEVAFAAGKSQVHWDKSTHCTYPSQAVDVAPYPINWSDLTRFHFLGGFIMGIACRMGVKLRWGGDWDGDLNIKEHSLHDPGHFELREV